MDALNGAGRRRNGVGPRTIAFCILAALLLSFAPETVALTAYGLATAVLLVFGFHAFVHLHWLRRHAPSYLRALAAARMRSPRGLTEFPRVLVQLPVYREPHVVERAIDAVAALDWPHDALEIQVLDDSADSSACAVDAAAARHRARGVPLRVRRRERREGFKAGALAEGLAESDAEFVAIFDADFVPPPDFLRRALPLFDLEDRVVCVQGRWGHLNRDQNRLTRAQAVGVDAHFFVQQLARAASGRFLNFNGTVGVWRTQAIRAAGGWSGETLTEDLDLSYRAQLGGGRIVFDPNLVVPCELPPVLGAYKSQQRRWASGSTQCARKYLRAVWSSDTRLTDRVEATLHLCGYSVCLAMLTVALLLPFAVSRVPMLSREPLLIPLWIAIWIAATGPIAVAIAGQRTSPRGRSLNVAAAILLGLGSSANNGLAVLRGLLYPIRTFVRTPKQGPTRAVLPSSKPALETAMALAGCAAACAWFPDGRMLEAGTYFASCISGFLVVASYGWFVEHDHVAR